MQEVFYNFFSDWLQGMILVMIIFHLSAYFFTKDKSFVYYGVYLFLISVFLLNIVDNPISNLIRNTFKESFEVTFWLVPVGFWMTLSMFFLEFLDIKNEDPQLYKTTIIYIKTNLILFTSLWIIDHLFFNNLYYFKYCVDTFLFTGVSYSIYVFFKIIRIKNKLLPLFLLGFSIALVISVNFHFSNYILPNNILNNFIDYKIIFVVGFFIKMIVLSIALNYKYELFRRKKEALNKRLINELKVNKRLKEEANKSLQNKVAGVIAELELVAKKAEKNKLAQIETEFKHQIHQLELSNLLSHINSHFVFNALNSIKLFIINQDKRKAALYLNKFSKLIRKILEASITKKTTLCDEIKTMQLYTGIENMRFDGDIKFSFKTDGLNTNQVFVPPLILHPFLENAIWHGVASLKTEKEISVNVYGEDENVIIKIKDNGIGLKASFTIEKNKLIKRTSFGINSVRERLANFYNEYNLEFTDLTTNNTNTTGTLVTLKIPKNL